MIWEDNSLDSRPSCLHLRIVVPSFGLTTRSIQASSVDTRLDRLNAADRSTHLTWCNLFFLLQDQAIAFFNRLSPCPVFMKIIGKEHLHNHLGWLAVVHCQKYSQHILH